MTHSPGAEISNCRSVNHRTASTRSRRPNDTGTTPGTIPAGRARPRHGPGADDHPPSGTTSPHPARPPTPPPSLRSSRPSSAHPTPPDTPPARAPTGPSRSKAPPGGTCTTRARPSPCRSVRTWNRSRPPPRSRSPAPSGPGSAPSGSPTTAPSNGTATGAPPSTATPPPSSTRSPQSSARTPATPYPSFRAHHGDQPPRQIGATGCRETCRTPVPVAVLTFIQGRLAPGASARAELISQGPVRFLSRGWSLAPGPVLVHRCAPDRGTLRA
jgi:hypothetical protein